MRPQLFSSLSPPTNNNTRARGIQSHQNLISLMVNFNLGNTTISALLLNSLTHLQIFMKELGIVLLIIPLSIPTPNDTNSETIRVNFMSQFFLPPRRRKH